MTPGDLDGVPTASTLSEGVDFAFSPEGKELVYTVPPVQDPASSTNHDLFTVPVEGGTAKQITTNPAADNYPCYSPDGKWLAYRAQKEPGNEASRWQIMLYERSTGKIRSLTENFDENAGAFVWSPDSQHLYFGSEEKGTDPIFSISISGNDVKKVVDKNVNSDVRITKDGTTLVFLHQTSIRPAEIYRASIDGTGMTPVTNLNNSIFAELDIPAPESVWYDGAGGTKVNAWLFHPPSFDPKRKYPLVLLVHGGPQGAWSDLWHYRWNSALWAAQGYIILAPNPRGSSGYGSKFKDEISRDWGNKAYEDLMKGVDYAETLPYVDSSRMAAAGGSFGGYMTDWMEGHTQRFKTLISHDGVYNFDSMYGTTEELWFDEHEHGQPWINRQEFLRYSPHEYAANFKTPMLIIHSDLDFRVPVTEGMQIFTVLQRKGIPSKWLSFPDEGHWILKPADSELWHRTVFEWLAQYLGGHGN